VSATATQGTDIEAGLLFLQPFISPRMTVLNHKGREAHEAKTTLKSA
jgi:hypothetical protein